MLSIDVPLLLRMILAICTVNHLQWATAVEVEFGEDDFSNAEGFPLMVSISRIGQTAGPIAVTVTPITFERFFQLPDHRERCGDDSSVFREQNERHANSTDFDGTVINATTILSQESREDIHIQITIFNDSILERNEVFVLLLDTVPPTSSKRPCSVGRIREYSRVPVNFSFSLSSLTDRSLVEHAGDITSLRLIKEGRVEFTLLFDIITRDISATRDADYTLDLGGTRVSMGPDDYYIEIPVSIIDDPIAEEDESFLIDAFIDDKDVKIPRIEIEFKIADNDYAQMGFINESTVYVFEGDNVTLCASLLNITIENFQRISQRVDIYTEPRTAIEHKHFIPVREKTLSFIGVDETDPHCITIATINSTAEDGLRELVAKITDSVGYQPHPLNYLYPTEVTVVIIERDVCGKTGSVSTPYTPLLNITNRINEEKKIYISWFTEEDPLHPVERYRGTVRVSDCTLNHTTDLNFNTESRETSYIISDTDLDTRYLFRVCAVNLCGENCTFLIPIGGCPIVTPVPPAPEPPIIIIVVVVVTVLLLLVLLALFFLLLCCCLKRPPKPPYFTPTHHHTQHFVQIAKRDSLPPKQQQQQLVF